MLLFSRRSASFLYTLAAALFAVGSASAATPCQALSDLTLKLASPVKLLTLSATDMPAADPLPAFCLVDATISSDGVPKQSAIEIQIWLPETGWNNRFLGTGNGGFGGSIRSAALANGLRQGYATGASDLGTGIDFQCNDLYCGSKTYKKTGGTGPLGGLYGDSAAIGDFGEKATHLMTRIGKQLVSAYYGRAAGHSYFHGCSTGGQQALMETQRFPTDYDGIVAGAPAFNRTHLHIAAAAFYEMTHVQADAYLTDEALALAHAAVLRQCAGTDGGLATDDYLTRPASCGFDAARLQCTAAQGEVPCTDKKGTTCSCLTANQTVSMNGEWAGAQDNFGRILYPGFERGTEEPVPLLPPTYSGNMGMNWQEFGTEPAFDSLMYWAFGPEFSWKSLFASTGTAQGELAAKIMAMDHVAVGQSDFATTLNAVDADLGGFNRHGGKLIMYAGYDDPLIPTAGAIDYYNAVHSRDGADIARYMRLFLAPGMWHCNGGPGANVFGNSPNTPPPREGSPEDDVLAAVTAWVEHGTAPDKIIATHYVNNNAGAGVAFQRPLCAYPDYARYKGAGHGSPLLATSYACKSAPYVTNQGFSTVYGP